MVATCLSVVPHLQGPEVQPVFYAQVSDSVVPTSIFQESPSCLRGLLTLVVLEHFLCVCSTVNAKGSPIKSDFDLRMIVICYT